MTGSNGSLPRIQRWEMQACLLTREDLVGDMWGGDGWHVMCRHRHRRTEMTPVRVSNWVSNANWYQQISQGQCNQQLNRLDVSLHSIITPLEE